MFRDKITSGQGAALCILTIMTNAFSSLPGAGRGAWVSHLLAGALALLCAWGFCTFCDRFPEKTFFSALTEAFGRSAACVIGAVCIAIVLLTCVVSLTVFSRFVQITALPRTPQIIIPALVVILAAFALARGVVPAAGSALLLVWFSAVVFCIYVVPGFGRIDASLLLPRDGIKEILIGSGEVFLNRFASFPALVAIYTRMPHAKRRGAFLSSVAGAGAALCIISAVTVSILGAELAKTDFYPTYTAMSVRGIGGFIQHTEIFACVAMTLALFFKSSVCLAFSDDLLSGMFKTERKRGTAVPLGVICAASTQLIYRDITSLRGMVEWKRGAELFFALCLILPLVLAFGRRKAR